MRLCFRLSRTPASRSASRGHVQQDWLLWSSGPAVPMGPPLGRAHLWGERSWGARLQERREAGFYARKCPAKTDTRVPTIQEQTGRSRLRDAVAGHRCPQPPAAAGVTWTTWKTHRSPGWEAPRPPGRGRPLICLWALCIPQASPSGQHKE